MGRIFRKRPKQAKVEPVTPSGIQRQLAWAAGSEYFLHRDPVYHVTEAFQTAFDRTGRQKARDREQPSLQEFSNTAFQRGNLAGAVLRGSGRMMLTSCLRRTVGQPSQAEQERTLSGMGAKTKSVPNGGTSQVVFHRGFVHSAVGLVVDVLQDGRRTVDLMTKIVQGKGGLSQQDGMETLRTMYPFLDHSREEELLAQYQQQLQQCGDVQEKALLQSAIIRAEALRNKKVQMKEKFTQKLREISDRANEALLEFQEPDFVDSLMRDLTEGDAYASNGRPTGGSPPDGPGAPDGGVEIIPTEPPTDPGSGPPGGAGRSGAGAASTEDDPGDGQ